MFKNVVSVLVVCVLSCPLVCANDLPNVIAGGLDNIIPTPQQMQAKPGKLVLTKGCDGKAVILIAETAARREKVGAEYLRDRIKLFTGVELPIVTELPKSKETAAIVIGSVKPKTISDDFLAKLSGEDKEFLSRKDGTEQDYVLDYATVDGRDTVILCGAAPYGTLYATMSLLHTLTKSDGDLSVPKTHIRDWPDIEYRWMTTHSVGDGGAEARINFAMEHKINIIKMSNTLAGVRYARDHGVKLLLKILYGNLEQQNRRSYPDGELYECLAEDKPDTGGYCLSNPALTEEKKKYLRNFVRSREPGCLFIHFIDIDFYDLTSKCWLNRCEGCRKKWPNDAIEAPDGKAGAQAYIFDEMAEAVFSVKNEESGYDASRDCLIMFVSSPYTRWSEPDDKWKKELAYYTTVSRLMKPYKMVHFAIRENSFNTDGTNRISELADELRKIGHGHKVYTYYHGADRRTTLGSFPVSHRLDRNFTCAPVMNKVFEKSGSLFSAGSSHPLIKAEYSWNVESTGYYLNPKTMQEFRKDFVRVLYDTLRTPEIHGEDGFIERALAHIYGPSSAKLMRPLYIPQKYTSDTPEILAPIGGVWYSYAQKERSLHDSAEINRQWAKLFAAYAIAGEKTIPNIERCLKAGDLNAQYRSTAESMLANVLYGYHLARLAQKESLILAAEVEGDSEEAALQKGELQELISRIHREAQQLDESKRKSITGLVDNFKKEFNEKMKLIPGVRASIRSEQPKEGDHQSGNWGQSLNSD